MGTESIQAFEKISFLLMSFDKKDNICLLLNAIYELCTPLIYIKQYEFADYRQLIKIKEKELDYTLWT